MVPAGAGGKSVKNRVHLDLSAADGKRRPSGSSGSVRRSGTGYPDHLVLADPEGNEFCLIGEG